MLLPTARGLGRHEQKKWIVILRCGRRLNQYSLYTRCFAPAFEQQILRLRNVAGDLRVGERSGRRLYSCTAPSRRPDTVPIGAKELVGRCGTAD